MLDFILERQFALFHPGKFQLVAIPGQPLKLNFLVETAMLGLQYCEHLPRIVVVHRPVLQEAHTIVTPPAVIGEPREPPAEPMRNPSDKRLVS